MIRSRPAASFTRSSLRYVSSPSSRTTSNLACSTTLRPITARPLNLKKPVSSALTLHKPLSTSLQRYATSPGNPDDNINKKHEEAAARQRLEPNPEEISATSSVHQIFEEKGVEEAEKDEDMLAGVKEDLVGFPPLTF